MHGFKISGIIKHKVNKICKYFHIIFLAPADEVIYKIRRFSAITAGIISDIGSGGNQCFDYINIIFIFTP